VLRLKVSSLRGSLHMLFLRRPRERLKDPIGGFRTDWSGPVTERISGLLKRPN